MNEHLDDMDFNLLDLAADGQGHGPPHALGRRLPAMVAELLQAAGLTARHASATIDLEEPQGTGWAVAAGLLDEGQAIELSRRMGPARHLAFGELGPPQRAGMTLKLRVLQRQDGAVVDRLEKSFFEEEALDIAVLIARRLARLIGAEGALDQVDAGQVVGTADPAALLRLQEGIDGLIAAEAGLVGSDLERALEHLTAALERDRSCHRARDLLRSALVTNAKKALELAVALSCARRIVELIPDDPEAALLLARLHRLGREPGQARTALQQALDRGARDGRLLLELAQTLNDLNEQDEALRLLRTELASGDLEAAPRVRADLHEAYGLALARTGAFDEAIEQLSQALEIDGPHSRLWANLGRCHHLAGQLEAARRAYERSLELAPRSWEVKRNFTELLLDLGDLSGAERTLREWLEQRPDDAAAALTLGEVLLAQDRPQQAEEVLGAATERIACEFNRATTAAPSRAIAKRCGSLRTTRR